MAAFGSLALLALSVIGLSAAALRLASTLAPRGLERVVAAAPMAAAAAVCESLTLGVFGWGTDPLALTGATLGLWLLARRGLPDPECSLANETANAWTNAGTVTRLAIGGVVAIAASLTLAFLHRPQLGLDGLHYHLPEAIEWVHDGRPGSLHRYIEQIPVENYPVTDEVILAWLLGMARSFVPVQLWMIAMAVVMASGGWLGLRHLGCDRLASTLGVAALLLVPQLSFQLSGPSTDVSSLAWLVCATGISVAARDRPLLLAPAMIAAALSVGTKTTTLPLSVLVCAWGFSHDRRSLRRIWLPLLAAGLVSAFVGGLWYARNLVLHGSPFWPLVAAPWGDPPTAVVAGYSVRFVDRPWATVVVVARGYGRFMLSGVVLIAGALLAGLMKPSRQVLGASVATAGSFLLWSFAPFTGVTEIAGVAVASTTRYLLPTLAAGALALALATRDRGPARIFSLGLLALAAAAGAVTLAWAPPGFPKPSITVATATSGALAACFLPTQRLWQGSRRIPLFGWALATTVLFAIALTPAVGGYVRRHSFVAPDPYGGVIGWAVGQPSFAKERFPVSITYQLIASFAGDRLQHPLRIVPFDEPCAALTNRSNEGWVVVRLTRPYGDPGAFDNPLARGCFADVRPLYADRTFAVYGVPPLG